LCRQDAKSRAEQAQHDFAEVFAILRQVALDPGLVCEHVLRLALAWGSISCRRVIAMMDSFLVVSFDFAVAETDDQRKPMYNELPNSRCPNSMEWFHLTLLLACC
jgi:hypothetical protein